MTRALSIFFTLACTVFIGMTLDNVYSDVEPIKALALPVACSVGNCKKHYGLSQIERNTLGQTLTYRWEDAVVNIDCRRAWFALGPRVCYKI